MTEHDEKADMIADQLGTNFMQLARLLRELQDEDPDTFFPVVDRLGLSHRKAYYLVQIDKTFSALPVKNDRLHKIGWTKLQRLCPHISQENWAELIALAERHTVHQLDAILRGEEPREDENCVLLYMTDTQYLIFRKALLQHGAIPAKGTLQNREAALVRALSKVLATNDNS